MAGARSDAAGLRTGCPELSHAVFVPHTEAECRLLDQLTDEVGDDESHPLASFMEAIGLLIEKYEDDHVPEMEERYILRKEPPKH